jgi:hypothetical protein
MAHERTRQGSIGQTQEARGLMAHRTIICGGPRVGKTTISLRLAAEAGLVARGTDELIAQGVKFQDGPEVVATWLDAPGHWVIEGVHTTRALRIWLDANETGLPFDRVFWSDGAKVTRNKWQESCAKGINTVWQQIETRLSERGAIVQRF